MKNDPIVDEIHRVREKLLEDCGGDLDTLMDSLSEMETDHQDRVVSRDELAARLRDHHGSTASSDTTAGDSAR